VGVGSSVGTEVGSDVRTMVGTAVGTVVTVSTAGVAQDVKIKSVKIKETIFFMAISIIQPLHLPIVHTQTFTKPMLPPLETPRLLLRKLTHNDVHLLYELDNDPDVMRFINGGIPTPFEIIQSQILPAFLRENIQDTRFGFWVMVDKETHASRGWVSARVSNATSTEAVLGYRLRKSAWGQGYATEAVGALLAYLFSATNITRVVATTYEHNLASRRVMEKAGMTLIRRFRLTPDDLLTSDTHHIETADLWSGDDVEYAISIDEYERTAVD